MRWLARRSSVPVTDTAGACTRDDDGAPSVHGQLLAEAERFITLFHAENPQAGPVGARIRQVLAEVTTYGTYRHTPEELAFAARVAWRSAGPVRLAAAGRPGFGITARLVRAAQGRGARGPAAPPGPVLVP